ncbi:MAG: hypothetical protein KGH60_01265 [Candidatus Micrarchaeota archaeon]|nr:hypothetical protein [Candidatus Micrarchaeota archaeon]
MAFVADVLNFLVIQLYAYIGTRHIYDRINNRREMRRRRMKREFSNLENFGSLLFSFLIAGMLFIGVSDVFPTLSLLSTPIWLVDLALLIIGYFMASAWNLIRNPYS